MHDSFGVKTQGEAINYNLVLGVFLLGWLPSDLYLLPFQLHLEACQSILYIAGRRNPHDGSDSVGAIVSAVLIKDLSAVFANLWGREFWLVPYAWCERPVVLDEYVLPGLHAG